MRCANVKISQNIRQDRGRPTLVLHDEDMVVLAAFLHVHGVGHAQEEN